jgi:AraC-like DNA-binding protein
VLCADEFITDNCEPMKKKKTVEEYRQLFATYAKDDVIDLDKRLSDDGDVQVYRLEDIVAGLDGVVPFFRRSKFYISFVKDGSGERTIGPYTYPIQKNTLAVILPRVAHRAQFSANTTGFLLSFSPDIFQQQAFPLRLLQNKQVLWPSATPYLFLTDEQAEEVATIFGIIWRESESSMDIKDKMVALKVVELLILCDRYYCLQHDCSDLLPSADTVQLFSSLLEEQFAFHHQVRFYAAALHVHPNHLNALVKKETGQTAKQIITGRILTEAKLLLMSTSLSVKEIAYALGFEDPNYFTSFFKAGQHTTPGQYRAAQR